MVEDLRKQASQLYRQETEKSSLPTSESLSMKKVYLVALALAVVALAAFAVVGTMKPRKNAVTAVMTPPALVKEAPPPELMDDPQPSALKQQAEGLPSAKADAKDVFELPTPAQPAPEPPKAVSQPKAPPPESAPAKEAVSSSRASPANAGKPALKRETAAASSGGRKDAEARKAAAEPPPPPPVPEISPEEKARRELARDIVIQKTPSFAELLIKSPSQEWKADPDPGGTYLVSFTLPDRTTGQPALYVWRVDISSRTVTPLSYNARSLP